MRLPAGIVWMAFLLGFAARLTGQSLEEAIRRDPDAALARAAGSGGMVEWEGVLELRVEDDFLRGESRTHWRLRTEAGTFEMYFGRAGAPKLRQPGARIRVRGAHGGNSIAVRELAMRETQPQLAVTPAAAQVCSTTGPQKIAVLKFTFPGNTTYPAGLNDTFFQQTWFGATGNSLTNYWQQTSYGKTSAQGGIFGPFALSQSYTCEQSDAFAAAALQAASGSVDLTQYTRFALLFPVASCSYGGLGSLGCEKLPVSAQVASIAWFPLYASYQTDFELGIVSHEHGHNLGLDHASTADYGALPLGSLDDPGARVEYGDPFSVMASSNSYSGVNVLGQYPAEQTSLALGWLTAGNYQEVQAAGTFTLAPYENSTGVRGLRILRDATTGSWMWLEYRQPLGMADSTLSAVPGSTNIYGGALGHYENGNLDSRHTYLVNFNAVGTPNSFSNPVLLPGKTWTDPASPLRITVNSATAAGLSVTVNYDAPCATGAVAGTPLAQTAGSGTLTVTAAAGCGWQAATTSSWIGFPAGSSGTGSGTLTFNVTANTAGAQRTGYITVGRQSVPVLQGSTGATILPMTPGSGSGTAATLTFKFSDPRGSGNIQHATLQVAGSPGCEVYVDTVSRVFFLLDDSGTQYLGPVTPGSATGNIANSQCTILGSGSSISLSGLTLQVGLRVTFSNSFAGTRRVLAGLTDSVTTYGPVPLGSWTVPTAATTIAALAGAGQTAVVGTAFGSPLQVVVRDLLQNLQAGVSVTFSVAGTAAGGTFAGSATVTTDMNGIATAPTLTANSVVGSFLVSAALTASPAVPTGFHLTNLSNALRFVPITPCRVLDTRNAAGPFGAPGLAGGSSRDFAIPNSACAVPATALAYSLNVAVVPTQGALGYLTIWPAGQAQPFTATLNSDGRVKSNGAVVPAGAGGAISVFASNPTHVILDVNGYFVSAVSTAALAYYPVTPCRIGDTRGTVGSLGGPYLSGGTTRTFPILSSACGLPQAAQAYSLNLAAVPRGSLGYLTVFPTGQALPVVASLNAPTGAVTANAAIVPAGSAGSVDIFASNDTDLVIDVNGYFAPAGTGGLSLYPLQPCRVLDTRLPAGAAAFSGTRVVNVTGSACGVPAAASAYVFNATAVPSGTLGYLTLWPNGAAQPFVASLNAVDGAVTGNLAIVPAAGGAISAFASNATHLVLDIFGYFAP